MLHGYGVRGYSWQWMAPHFAGNYDRVLRPDLHMEDIQTLLSTTQDFVRRVAQEDGAPVDLVGHSLGGLVGAAIARVLGPETVSKLAVISSPFGSREEGPGRIMRFLLKYRLIPDFLIRPRFFSGHTPVSLQKELFKNAVPETLRLQEELFSPGRFRSEEFVAPLSQPSLAVASAADRIVPLRETRELADRLGALLYVYEPSRHVGHDDTLTSPAISRETADNIISFFETGSV